jgi:chaperonin cofactor prefoldin
VPSAGDLRARLVRRLSELDARIATLTRTIVEAQTNASELRVRLSEALQDVTLVVPRPTR